MRFDTEKIKEVRQHVRNHVEEIDLWIGKNDTDMLKALLNSITEEKTYSPGEQIREEHMNSLKLVVNEAIKNSAQATIQLAKDKKSPIKPINNPVEHLMTVADYFYVRAMEKLGCPNMPLFAFDPDIQQTVERSAMALDRAFGKYDISKEKEFKSQRGKNADELDKKFTEHCLAIDSKNNKPKHMGELVAEYQALKERQKNHGPIWRFFHKDENRARNSLLSKMEKKIKETVHKSMGNDPDTLDPAKVARFYADASIRGHLAVAGDRRISTHTEKIFGALAVDQIRIDNGAKESMASYKAFVDEINGKEDKKLSEPVVSDKDTVKENAVSKEDNDFRLLD